MALNEKQLNFIDAYCEALDSMDEPKAFAVAKEFAGYDATASRRNVITDAMYQEIQEYYNKKMITRLSKASNAIDDVLTTPDMPGATNLLSAANSVFDRGGVIKKEAKEVTVKSPTGIVAMPPKGELDPEV